ncbi:metallophosphoesterase [Bacillaceae bacterium SIJ1]|uniref:YfcE family phosphodiesterase n=1 Tax=Litoribacterium kuwaitense TaxID=1398745 RepID=UPI0013EA11F6|nr:metallophosphoesterase [Litoribacterium kuwaitense]NGP44983.1 metallophosphoesterase [Litoribacterium kuwaitense]
MTKPLIVLSDSHGYEKELAVIHDRYEPDVTIIHCGDSELDPKNPYVKNMTIVKGNCDAGAFPEVKLIEWGGYRLFVAHGHRHGVKQSPEAIVQSAKQNEAHVVLHGHSHIAEAFDYQGILVVNPGSVRLPRMRKEKTYAELHAEGNDIIIHCKEFTSGRTIFKEKWSSVR